MAEAANKTRYRETETITRLLVRRSSFEWEVERKRTTLHGRISIPLLSSSDDLPRTRFLRQRRVFSMMMMMMMRGKIAGLGR